MPSDLTLIKMSKLEKLLKVLVVDDDRMLRMIIERQLTKYEDFEVVTASNIEEARQEIVRMLSNGGLDVVLSDWDMHNRGDGVHVLSAGREAGVAALVGMSGRLIRNEAGEIAENDIKQAMQRAGATEFLAKPFDGKQVVTAIRNAVSALNGKNS